MREEGKRDHGDSVCRHLLPVQQGRPHGHGLGEREDSLGTSAGHGADGGLTTLGPFLPPGLWVPMGAAWHPPLELALEATSPGDVSSGEVNSSDCLGLVANSGTCGCSFHNSRPRLDSI